jgi:hypothetical protein
MSTIPSNVRPAARNMYDDSVEAAAKRAGFSEEAINRFRNRKTAPKKYVDGDRSLVSIEWRLWNEKNKFDADEVSQQQLLRFGDGPANHAAFYPEQYDKDLGDGAWVLVIDPPVTVQWSQFKVPLLSLWWARPHVLNDGAYGKRLPYQGIIQTPAGDLHLWPHEYTICRDPQAFIGEEGVGIHTLGGEPLLDEDMLFYLRSRGISRNDATAMLFNQIAQPNYCYATMPKEAKDMFVGVGTRAQSTVVDDYKSGFIQ